MTASDLDPADTEETGARPAALYRWGMLVARRKRVVFAVWVLLLVAGLAFIRQFSASLSSGMTWVPGSQSSRAAALLARDLPAAGGNQAVLVFSSRTLTATDPGFQRVVATAARNISAIPGIGGIQVPRGAAARGLVAPGGHTVLAVAALPSSETAAVKLVPRLDAAAAAAAITPGVRVGVTGEPALDRDGMTVANNDIARADRVGMPLAVLVLLVVFGSLVAAGMPLLLALASLLVSFGGFGAFYLVTGTSLSTVLESVTLMIGLGIGIDYALFIITRFREELAHSKGPAAAAATATATAGRTVLVSGSTVIVALAPLLLVNTSLFRQVAAGPMIVVAVLAAAAVSLLPAALAGLGPRINRLAVPLPRWLRWSGRPQAVSRLTTLVLRRPLIVLMSGVAVLGALALFTLQLKTGYDYGLSALRNQPAGRADTTIAAAFGPGAISPTQVVFTTTGNPLSAHDLQAIAALNARLARDPRVASVTSLPTMLGGPAAAARTLAAARTSPALAASLSPVVNARHGATLTVMTITPRTAFDTTQASQLVNGLRAELPAALHGTGMRALVGGATAAVTDLTHEINAKTPLVMALIIIIALLLLGAAFGSPLVALTGLAGTMLSVGAAYGLLHCVFQAGHAGDIFGYHSTGFVEAFLPLILFAILVGLSTDYQVFLISRIKEEWEHSHDPAAAIAAGLARSGRVILSAATIMVVVFGSFVLTTYPVTKELGFALAVVILIDAAVTRRLLVPAALRLLGNHAWSRPRPAPRRPRRELTTQP